MKAAVKAAGVTWAAGAAVEEEKEWKWKCYIARRFYCEQPSITAATTAAKAKEEE